MAAAQQLPQVMVLPSGMHHGQAASVPAICPAFQRQQHECRIQYEMPVGCVLSTGLMIVSKLSGALCQMLLFSGECLNRDCWHLQKLSNRVLCMVSDHLDQIFLPQVSIPMPSVDRPPPKVSCIPSLPVPNLLTQSPTKTYLLTQSQHQHASVHRNNTIDSNKAFCSLKTKGKVGPFDLQQVGPRGRRDFPAAVA